MKKILFAVLIMLSLVSCERGNRIATYSSGKTDDVTSRTANIRNVVFTEEQIDWIAKKSILHENTVRQYPECIEVTLIEDNKATVFTLYGKDNVRFKELWKNYKFQKWMGTSTNND